MHRSLITVMVILTGLVGLSTPSIAQQSKVILTAAGDDISADGNSVLGTILDPNVNRRMHIFTRGSGHTIVGPVLYQPLGLYGSADFSFIASTMYNGVYGAPQNPPFGFYTDIVACCVGSSCTVTTWAACTGTRIGTPASCSPNPCPAPVSPPAVGACCDPTGVICTLTTQPACASPNYWLANYSTCGSNPCRRGHYVPHRFSQSAGTWTNLGSFPNVAGQGAAKCDANVAASHGISANGQFVAGDGLYGNYGTTSCAFRGYVWSQIDNSVRILPPTGTGCQVYSQAEYVSNDGLIVVGTDTQAEPTDPTGITAPVSGSCNVRTLTVWERPTSTSDFVAANRTVLDRFGAGGLGTMNMTSTGKVFAYLSANAARFDLGDPALAGSLVRYEKISGVWTRTVLGQVTPPSGLPAVGAMYPYAVSDDESTVVGVAVFGSTNVVTAPSAPFIWRANINGGIPMLLDDYVTSINGGPLFTDGSFYSFQGHVSGDGNALLISVWPPAPASCPTGTGLQDLGRAALLYLNGANIGCEPPRIVGGPYNVAQTEFIRLGIVGNVFVSGSWPMAMQWQKETPTGSGNWVNLSDSCGTFTGDNTWNYEGTRGFQLRVNMLADPAVRDGNFRVVATNACGSTISEVAAISAVTGACCSVAAGQTFCTIEMPTRCSGSAFLGGGYLGDNVACSPAACDAISGACCSGGGGPNAACVVTIQAYCTQTLANGGLAGVFAGNGTTCSPTTCGALAGACCYSTSATSNVICTIELSNYCTRSLATGGLLGVYRGNNTTCSPTACATVSGACCASPAVGQPVACTIQTQSRCENEIRQGGLQGLYAGSGQTCDPGLCSVATGACCHSLSSTQDAICTIQIQNNCIARVNGQFFDSKLVMGLGGVYRGDGTTCGPTSCTNFVGACCFVPFGELCNVCTIQPQVRCTDPTNIGGLAGVWGGAASVCSPATCAGTGPGACCAGSFCLISSCETDCANNLGGTYQGAGSACGPTTCGGVPDSVCCRGATCSITTQANCTVASGTAGAFFMSGTTTCNSSSATSPCCHADYNKVGGVSVQDIFDFLNDWFAGSPYANTGGNGTGTPQVQSIFDYLNAWFAGGC